MLSKIRARRSSDMSVRLARRSALSAARAARREANSNGYVLYRGPSSGNGSPIVVIATKFRSARNSARSQGHNSKTGAMVQIYIIREDMHPLEAIASGADKSICFGCIHASRPTGSPGVFKKGTCYVQVSKGPAMVYKGYRHGAYVDATGYCAEQLAALFRGLGVRISAYGDPAAVPASAPLFSVIHAAAALTTGYTHQWRNRLGAHLRGVVMASCDNEADRLKARDAGWGTFTVTVRGATLSKATLCPASDEAGKLATCDACRQCSGTAGADIYIPAHGTARNRFTGRRALPVLS